MTITSEFATYAVSGADLEGSPPGDLTVAPTSIDEAGQILDRASEHGLTTTFWGGGTHQGYGRRVHADLVVSTARLNGLVDWQPDDMTVTVEGGMKVAELEKVIAQRGQTAVLPEIPGDATVGGVLAAGVSGWRRLRYGPSRDRLLEVDLVTGDGRHVRAGGRVVKNVTGFDLPRLTVGSHGALGLIAQVCLKLWPVPTTMATVTVDDGDAALEIAYRPAALVETDDTAKVYLGGTEAEVAGQAAALGGTVESGWWWEPEPTGTARWSLRVPPAETRAAIERLPSDWRHQAGLGVGEIRLASPGIEDAAELRAWAESRNGALVLVEAPPDAYDSIDPWGTPPPGIDIQRRIVERFDPVRILNPGRLPGGI